MSYSLVRPQTASRARAGLVCQLPRAEPKTGDLPGNINESCTPTCKSCTGSGTELQAQQAQSCCSAEQLAGGHQVASRAGS